MGTSKSLGLDEQWAYRTIAQVGNYGESYEHYFGADSPVRYARGVKALWIQGGVSASDAVTPKTPSDRGSAL